MVAKAGNRSGVTGALATVAAGVAGLAWFWLYLAPPRLGFSDTDDPSVSLAFLRVHHDAYAQEASMAMLFAALLLVAVLSMHGRLATSVSPLAARWAAAVGIVGASCFFVHGVFRAGVEPLLYIDGLNRAWGESAYLAVQMIGVHGVGQGGILALSAWIGAVAVIGGRSAVIPKLIAWLAIVPGLRIVGILGPFGLAGLLPEAAWLVFLAAIPGSMIWLILLGVATSRPRGVPVPVDAPVVASPAG